MEENLERKELGELLVGLAEVTRDKELASIGADLQKISSIERVAQETEQAAGGRPRFAYVNDEKVVVSVLKDGTNVYAAADKDGEPLFVNGHAAVIDPFTGRLRFKVPHQQVRSSEAFEQFSLSNGLSTAQAALGTLSPGFLAFAKAVKPVPGLYSQAKVTRWQRIRTRIITALAMVVFKFKKVLKALRPKKPDTRSFLSLAKLDIPLPIEISTVIPSMRYEIEGTNKLAFARFIAIRVPLTAEGEISDFYLNRFKNFVFDMTMKGLFKYGHLSPPVSIQLPLTSDEGLRYEKVIFASFFTDQLPEDDFGTAEKALNEKVGYPIFMGEGVFPETSDWTSFPW